MYMNYNRSYRDRINNQSVSSSPETQRMKKINQMNYQKGYADGYRRSSDATKVQDDEYQYMYTVILILLVFIVFVLIIVYMYNPKIIRADSNYKGDCLLDLSSTYYTEGCLDR